MRRLTACVLMMTLLLAGCQAGGAGETPEERALAVRDLYQSLAGWNATVDITAEVGEKVFDFTLDAAWRREGETVLTITAPELLAGITARIAEGETVLEYDGAGVSLGLLDDSGLTPVSAVAGLMAQIEKGYQARCVWAGDSGEILRVTYRDPETGPNTGTEYLLDIDRESGALLRAEASVGGRTVLTAQFTNFTMEEAQDDTGDGENLG